MLRDLERRILNALLADKPAEALPESDADGVRLTALLLQKLRFERICRGDKRAEEWFERDPEGFAKAFQAYARAVPPREYWPRQEAESFRAWCGANFGGPAASK